MKKDELLVAKRYAKAFIDSIGDATKLRTSFEELRELLPLLKNNDLRHAVFNPLIPIPNRMNLITSLISLNDQNLSFLEYLLKKKRLGALEAMLSEIETYLWAQEKKVHVRLLLASQVSDAVLEKIRAKAQQHFQREPVFDITIDPSLIGGFVLEAENQKVDASVRFNLESLEREIIS